MDSRRFAVVGGPAALRPAARRAVAVACHLGVPVVRAHEVELAVHETLANAFEHGHGGDPGLPIDVEVAVDGSDAVAVRITDRATAGMWRPAGRGRSSLEPIRGAVGERGRGRTLIEHAADESNVQVAPGRSTVILRWSTGPAGTGDGARGSEVAGWHG